MYKTIAVFVLLTLNGLLAKAQDPYKWMLGINGGAMIYQGDLAPSAVGSYRTASFTFGASAGRILSPYFAVRANAVFGKLRGNDAEYNIPSWRQHRNFNFSTPVSEFSAQLLWNPFGNNSNELSQRVTPYLFGGAGISFLNITREHSRLDTTFFPHNSKQQTGLKQDTAKTPPASLLVLPVGAGLSFYLTPRWSLNFETIFRYTFSDYLDGFSYAANPNEKDFYHSHTLGLVYRFGGNGKNGGNDRLGCPKH